MLVGINLFEQLLKSGSINNVTITSYIPFDNQVYGGMKPVMCNLFIDSFQKLFQNDNVELYCYGSQEMGYMRNINRLSFDEYKTILDSFRKVVDSYNLNISFRDVPELFAEYTATMNTIPASGLVNIVSSSYETVVLNQDNVQVSIPGIFVNKLPINEFAKALFIIQPQLSLSVLSVNTLYDIYISTFPEDQPHTSNVLFKIAPDISFLNRLADSAMTNVFRRELGREEIIRKCMNSDSPSSELVEYAKVMMMNYNLTEKTAYQFLLYSSNNIKTTIDTFNMKLGIQDSTNKDRIILLSFNDKRILDGFNMANSRKEATLEAASGLFTTF